jgi:diguanylate cyclase (GGDEF)-like protein
VYPTLDPSSQQPAALKRELKDLRSILSVAQVVVSSLDLDEVLQNILCSAMAILDMPAGSVALYEENSGQLTLHAHSGLSAAFVAHDRWQVKLGGLTHRLLAAGEIQVLQDCADSPLCTNPLLLQEGIRSLVAVPLKVQEKIVGILYLDDFAPRVFATEQLHMLSVLASFASMSIDNARLHREMCQLASTDGLTGLYNHRIFSQMLKEELSRASRYSLPLALVMFDVDDFKRFNDSYGHPVGDQVLVAVAEILRETLRKCDIPFRYGGEEFIAILPETLAEPAALVAERIRQAIETQSRRHLPDHIGHGVTVSVGVAAFPRDGESGESLLKMVDDLLYRAKKEGKNKVYCHWN